MDNGAYQRPTADDVKRASQPFLCVNTERHEKSESERGEGERGRGKGEGKGEGDGGREKVDDGWVVERGRGWDATKIERTGENTENRLGVGCL